MRTIHVLSWLVLAASAVVPFAAAEPPAGVKGKVLVLENDRVLEGNIEKVGRQYVIRRTVGETWVPGERVLAMCQSKEDAYRFMRSRANLDDADEHLGLAQWCHLNGLPEQCLPRWPRP